MISVDKITIRKGIKEDLKAAHQLIRELAVFEKAPDQVTNTVADMEKDRFGTSKAFELLIAEFDGQIAGIAIYFIKYSTWKGKGIYLDDLIVTEKFRGRGIGKKLFEEVITEAKKIKAKQLHWQVLDWNKPAIDFYKKYDASIDAEWLDCKLSEEQIARF